VWYFTLLGTPKPGFLFQDPPMFDILYVLALVAVGVFTSLAMSFLMGRRWPLRIHLVVVLALMVLEAWGHNRFGY
jgi:hypothetical protein